MKSCINCDHCGPVDPADSSVGIFYPTIYCNLEGLNELGDDRFANKCDQYKGEDIILPTTQIDQPLPEILYDDGDNSGYPNLTIELNSEGLDITMTTQNGDCYGTEFSVEELREIISKLQQRTLLFD